VLFSADMLSNISKEATHLVTAARCQCTEILTGSLAVASSMKRVVFCGLVQVFSKVKPARRDVYTGEIDDAPTAVPVLQSNESTATD